METSTLDPLIRHAALPQATAHRRAGVDVWLLPLEAWRPHADELQPVVDAMQRGRIAALRDPGLRRDRLLAHALHRIILAQALGVPPVLLPLDRSPLGQPVLGLQGWHTSLSHAADVVAVALAGAAVGVDVESRETASLSPIADLVCAPTERAALPVDAPARQARQLSTWVRKEAALKAAGIGLAREMASFALDEQPIALADAGGRPMHLHVHTHGEGTPWMAAVACESSAPPQWHWRTPAHPPFQFN